MAEILIKTVLPSNLTQTQRFWKTWQSHKIQKTVISLLLLQLMPCFLGHLECFHVSVGGQNLECLINPAINKSGEVTIGVTELQLKALHLAFLHANRLAEKPPVGKNIGMQKREAGWQEGRRTKTRVSRQVG